MPTAFLFPGQASQTPDMRELVERVRPDLLELAVEVVGEDPFARVDEGTDFAQPAIFCASLAGLATLDAAPDVVAGHSLGELTALVAAGALAERDALALVAERGRLMEAAGRASGDGGMLAVLGRATPGEVASLAERHGVAVANDNAPGQVVLSGDRRRLEAAAADARESGLKSIALGVAGAFHSPFMAPAAEAFGRAVDAIVVRPPKTPVLSCVTAAPVEDPDAIRLALVDGLTSPVRWRETLLALEARGIDAFVETGPGTVLTKLVKRTLTGIEATTAHARTAVHA